MFSLSEDITERPEERPSWVSRPAATAGTAVCAWPVEPANSLFPSRLPFRPPPPFPCLLPLNPSEETTRGITLGTQRMATSVPPQEHERHTNAHRALSPLQPGGIRRNSFSGRGV